MRLDHPVGLEADILVAPERMPPERHHQERGDEQRNRALRIDPAELASFDASQNKFQSDPQAMAVFRRGIDWGSHSHWPKDEVLISAPTIA